MIKRIKIRDFKSLQKGELRSHVQSQKQGLEEEDGKAELDLPGAGLLKDRDGAVESVIC